MNHWPAVLDRRPAGVVFDCDGLLVDTEPCWQWANEQVLLRRGQSMTDAQHEAMLGLSTPPSAALLATWLDEVGREDEIAAEMLAGAVERIGSHARAMPGAVAVVERLAGLGVPMAVASNSPPAVVELALARGGLTGWFAVVVGERDALRPKPAPDPYLLACSRLGIEASRAVGVEDSQTGLAALRAAGLASIGVPSVAGEFPADWVLPSLADPALTEWIDSWA